MKKIEADFSKIAKKIMFEGITEEKLLTEEKLVYRKGKTIKDLKKQLQIAKDPKKTFAKTEMELEWFQDISLPKVFKKHIRED